MDLIFANRKYDRLETDARYTADFSSAIVSQYRRRLQQIRSASDERDLYALRSLRLERLKGDRVHQYSIRLNDQWRLIIELEGKGVDKVVVVIGIEDYH